MDDNAGNSACTSGGSWDLKRASAKLSGPATNLTSSVNLAIKSSDVATREPSMNKSDLLRDSGLCKE